MAFLSLRTSTLPRLLLPLLAGALALSVMHTAPHAAERVAAKGHPYLMPADEGYGLTECMAKGGACARVVADAWCEAHGHVLALTFGPADDITGSVNEVSLGKARPDNGNYLVTCGD